MKRLKYFGMVLMAILLSVGFSACSNEDEEEGFGLQIGDLYKGGYICYIDNDGHGYVVSSEFKSGVNQQQAESWAESYSAGGNSDWFLPSIYEAELIANLSGIIDIPNNYYWSSTYASGQGTTMQYYTYGLNPYFHKNNAGYTQTFYAMAMSEFDLNEDNSEQGGSEGSDSNEPQDPANLPQIGDYFKDGYVCYVDKDYSEYEERWSWVIYIVSSEYKEGLTYEEAEEWATYYHYVEGEGYAWSLPTLYSCELVSNVAEKIGYPNITYWASNVRNDGNFYSYNLYPYQRHVETDPTQKYAAIAMRGYIMLEDGTLME